MKQFVLAIALIISFSSISQTNSELKQHFENYYLEMKKQGDIPGVINAMTHLNILDPSVERRDTLAYLYMSENQFRQALNTIGLEKNETDSNMNVEVKAISLKNLNRPQLALEYYEILFKRSPNVYLAYEMADMKLLTKDLAGAKQNIEYGLTNVTDDMKRAFYETQQPYETSMKAALFHLKGLLAFSEDNTNYDGALKFMNDALAIDPNFNLAKRTREALEAQKANKAAESKN